MNDTKDRVVDATANVRPYIERALRDEELRRNVRSAYASARALYDELLSPNDVGEVATKLASDEHVHEELRNVVEQLRHAAGRVQRAADDEAAVTARRARNSLLLVAGVVLGLFFNPLTGPALRGWAGRTLFGRGNGFEYRGDQNGSAL